MGRKVFVGLSGGVDSAVSAALLKEAGHDVTGVFIKIWQPEFIECTWRADRLDAMRVAAALSIPFCEIDLSDEYKDTVVKEMVDEYERGVTPNPDVLCNRSIKFGAFAEWARSEGADMIATGHYARIQRVDGRPTLLRGLDGNKDQSYFLHLLSERDLGRCLFPVGGYTKSAIRAKARSYGLPVAEKADSQGLCFVGDITLRDFLSRYIPVSEGDVINAEGAVVGRHDGAALYTVGQRHGLRMKGGVSPAVHYVVRTDIEHNTVTVSTRKEDAAQTRMRLHAPHWISMAPSMPLAVSVQTRYRETPVEALVKNENGVYDAVFAEPHVFSPGQSAVFYDGERVLGGAVIQSASE